MGIHFDRLAELFQDCEPLKKWKCGDMLWREVAQRAALFEIPIQPTRENILALTGEPYEPETVGFLRDNFVCPFPDIIVEDNAGCVIVSDVEEKQRGFEGYRQILTYRANTTGSIIATSYLKATIRERSTLPPDAVMISQPDTGDRYVWNAETPEMNQHAITLIDDTVLEAPFLLARSCFTEDAFCAFDEIIYLNTPNRYILQERPLNPTPEERQAQWRRRVLRTHERARFVLLRPGEIKAKYFPQENPDREHHTREPHWRRAHYRHLTSEFYKLKRGSTVLIPATWIGEEVARRGNQEYRVLLDR